MTRHAAFDVPIPGDVLRIPCLGSRAVQVVRVTRWRVTLVHFPDVDRPIAATWWLWSYRRRCRDAQFLCTFPLWHAGRPAHQAPKHMPAPDDGADHHCVTHHPRKPMNAIVATPDAVSPPPRFVTNDDGTITDTTTNLMWSPTLANGELDYADAEAACKALTLGGHTDWQLPTYDQLAGLVDRNRYNPAIDPAFVGTESDWYWTSTPAAWSPSSCAWVVYFDYGDADDSHRNFDAFVRAVRSVGVPSGQ